MNHSDSIEKKRKEFGSSLAILAHHYQSDAVLAHADHAGDSLELARMIGKLDATHIVFCGVWFMAESAAILCRPGQRVHIPDAKASCAMADMASAMTVKKVLKHLRRDGRNVIPLTYVNSSAGVKGVVGEFGGSVCTSANAPTMLRWAMDQGDGVLFLPDMHLGNNTADRMGIPEERRTLVDTAFPAPNPDADLFLWPGFCPVHDMYVPEDVAAAREADPGAQVVVHPESPPAVVREADGSGSTSYLIKYAAEAPKGSTIYVGTEQNLVQRLADQYAGEKTVKHLDRGYCEDMAMITEEKLAHLLGRLETALPVQCDPAVAAPARLALERMLQACA
jgi:quinolinate synthase